MFWVDCCEPPHIGRIGMDGQGQTVIIDTEIYNPSALTIDYTNKRIYWADDNHILFANMDGTQRRKGETKVLTLNVGKLKMGIGKDDKTYSVIS